MSDRGADEDRVERALRLALEQRDAALRHAAEARPDAWEDRVMERFRATLPAGATGAVAAPARRLLKVRVVRLAALVAVGVLAWLALRTDQPSRGMVLLGDRMQLTLSADRGSVSWTEPEPGCTYDVTVADASDPSRGETWLAHDQNTVDVPAAVRNSDVLAIGVVAKKGAIAVGSVSGEFRRP